MPVDLHKRTFTVDEYYKMASAGIFERERVELVEGEVVAMAPLGSRHAACVGRMQDLFVQLLETDALVRVQQSLRISDRTELVPDIAIVRYRSDYYVDAHPTPDDAILVIEVADSSLAYDREVKMPLYARAGVHTAWLVDLNGQAIHALSEPTAEGYRQTVVTAPGQELKLPAATRAVQIRVDDLLP